MKKQTQQVAVVLASILMVNSIAFATPEEDGKAAGMAAAGIVNAELLDESDKITVSNIQDTIKNVDALIYNIRGLSASASSNDQNQRLYNIASFSIAAFGAAAGRIHFQDPDIQTIAGIVTAVGSNVLTRILESYRAGQKFDVSTIKKMLADNRDQLEKGIALTTTSKDSADAMRKAIDTIIDMNTALDENAADLQSKINDDQIGALIIATAGILLHHSGGLIPKKLSDKLSATLVARSKNATQVGKDTGLMIASGSNIVTLLATFAGINTPGAQEKINKILGNLEKTRYELTVSAK